jgi:hypothetical protein
MAGHTVTTASARPARRAALALGTCLAIALAGQVNAATWNPPIPLSTSREGWGAKVVAAGGTSAVALFWHFPSRGVFVRRTTDAGATWAPALEIAPAGVNPAIASRGTMVGVVWSGKGGIKFRRSLNGGVTFAPTVDVGSRSGFSPAVSIGSSGVVAVAWASDRDGSDEGVPGKIKVKVSTDGGQTFGPPVVLAIGNGIGYPTVAVGDGVVYVAYMGNPGIFVRTSRDNGTTWSTPSKFARFSKYVPLLVADGSEAYLSYISGIGGKYRRTTDKGETWSGLMYVTSASYASSVPIIAFGGPHVIATQHVGGRIVYRDSPDGVSWSRSQTVWSPPVEQPPIGLLGGVAYPGRPLVVYVLLGGESAGWDVYARTRSAP